MQDVGAEQFTDEDRLYSGSRFRDVVDALFANPYQKVWGREGEPPLPDTEVTIKTVFGGLLSRGRPPRFERASERSLDSAADLRWGPDRKGFRRFLHPDGVCLLGRWQITEDTPYTGYFSRGSSALVAARFSSGAGGSRRGQVRSMALVGKLFPTTDPDHAAPLRTANFITQEDIGGTSTVSINDAELRNAPDVTVFRRGPAGTILIKVASVFQRVDQEPTIRQVYPIAELGKPADQPTRAPQWRRGHPLHAPDVARGSQRPVHRDAHQRDEGPVTRGPGADQPAGEGRRRWNHRRTVRTMTTAKTAMSARTITAITRAATGCVNAV